MARLLFAWITVAAFLAVGPTMIGRAGASLMLLPLFGWALAAIVGAAFGVVHEAEALAARLGEPFGTLVLTLSIVVIEVALISAAMLGGAHATLGRDTMFAVLMIVLNGVVGLGLLVGGLRYHQQSYNLQGASAYLAVILPLAVIALVMPNVTVSSAGGTFTPAQAICFSIFTIALYGLFLALQTGQYRSLFAPVEGSAEPAADLAAPHGRQRSTGTHLALLLLHILPVVILAKSLAKLLDKGLPALGLPPALAGVLIAMVVFTPEGISALRAVAANQLTRAINLCLGAATSTLGLSVPAVLLIGLATGTPVVLGLSGAGTVLLALTLVLAVITFSNRRTTMIEGAVHLVLFGVFLVLVFAP